jgi:serine/threonine protein kinase
MALPSITAQVKSLGTREKLAADPRFGPHISTLGPLLKNVSSKARSTVKTLGKGAFGRVNLERLNIGNLVATKYFTSSLDNDPDDFIHEIAASRYLRGLPNVAQMVGVGAATHGQPLPSLILAKAKDNLGDIKFTSWGEAMDVIKQVLYGYYVLHERGIAHRDTKPQNMLITDLGEVHISDFGMSKYVTPGTYNDVYTGTYEFSSPELLLMSFFIKNKYKPFKIDSYPVNWFAHDVWAVGASLYNILTGEYLVGPVVISDDEARMPGSKEFVVLYNLLTTYGTPTGDEGQMHDLFMVLENYRGRKMATSPKISIKDRIIEKARIKPEDPAQLDQIAGVIASMLQYDPAKRPTMKALLEQPILGGVPFFVSKPTLEITEDITPAGPKFKIITDWIYDVEKEIEIKYRLEKVDIINKTTRIMTVLDRTCIYILEISDIATKLNDPLLTKIQYLQALGCIALYISLMLFGESDYLMRFVDMSAKAYTKEQLINVLNRIMTYDIQFYGKTLYDELLEVKEVQDDLGMQWKLGLLNMIVYQQNYLKSIPKDQLKELMIRHARIIDTEPTKIYLHIEKDYAIFKPFIDEANTIVASLPAPAPAPANAAPAPANAAPAPANAAPAPANAAPASANSAPAPANSAPAPANAAPAPANAAPAQRTNLFKGDRVTDPGQLKENETYIVTYEDKSKPEYVGTFRGFEDGDESRPEFQHRSDKKVENWNDIWVFVPVQNGGARRRKTHSKKRFGRKKYTRKMRSKRTRK